MRLLAILLFLLLPLSAPLTARAERSLVDKVMDVLNGKGVESIKIETPPPAPVQNPKTPGVEIAHNYLPVYGDTDMEGEPPLVLPFFASRPLGQPYPDITNLIIIVPDFDREAARAFAFARSAGDEAASRHPEWMAAQSYVFAPQFLAPEDIAAHKDDFPDGGKSLLRWPSSTWIDGGLGGGETPENSLNRTRASSSFEVMDYLLLILSRPQFFPHLQHVVIAGTGAGANFVQRYAVLGAGPDMLSDNNIDVRFVVMQARSFIYIDKMRANLSGALPDGSNIGFTEITNCPAANTYPFGFDNLPDYAKKQGPNDIRLRFPTRRVFYMVSQNSPDFQLPTTPEACAFGVQGKSALTRAQFYFASLNRLYGDDIAHQQSLVPLPALAEDGLSLWRSPCATSALYGDGACPQK